MFALFFQSKCLTEEFISGNVFRGKNVSNFRLSAGDGTCFVKCYDLDFACFFQRNCCFEKNTVSGTHTVTYHDCNWCGKSQCTWAADNKNRDTSGKCITEFVSCKKPDQGSDNGDTDYSWYKYTGHLICNFGNRSLGSSCVTDHFDDLGQSGIFTDSGGFAFNEAGLIDSGSGNHVSGSLVYRDAFAGKGSFVNGTGSLQDHTIYRNIFAGTYYKDVSFVNLFDGNCVFHTVFQDYSCFGSQFHKVLESIGRFAFGTCFQHFADSDQSKDHGGGFKIKFHHIVHNSGRITVYLCSCHGKEGIYAPYERGHGTQSYQGIHIRGTMPQALEAADKEFLVDDHDDACKKKLYQSHGNVVVVKPGRERPSPHHVSHGEVHQYQQKSYRCNKAAFQNGGLMILQGFFCLGHGDLLLIVGSFEGGSISCLFYSCDDIMGGGGSFYSHGVGQKADRAGGDARYFGNSLLYPGAACRTAHPGDVVLFHYEFSFLLIISAVSWSGNNRDVSCFIWIFISSVSEGLLPVRQWFHLYPDGYLLPRSCEYGWREVPG